MKKLLGFFAVALLLSCKAKSVIAEAKAGKELPAKEIITSHYRNNKDFRTLYLKADARYEDANTTQNVQAEIRIRKDEIILVSVRFIGITMAKAIITPDQVKYYEKINGEYFEGDYGTLSQWLGTDLDFQKVQNMLLGMAMDDLSKGEYASTVEDKMFKLENKTGDTKKAFYFEAGRFLIKKQQISQPIQHRTLEAEYPNHTEYQQAILPTGILIEAIQRKGKTNIEIEYKSASFNEELSFPYAVPDGYDRIFID